MKKLLLALSLYVGHSFGLNSQETAIAEFLEAAFIKRCGRSGTFENAVNLTKHPLARATLDNNLKEVNKLLKSGVNPNDKGTDPHPALFFAAWRGHSKIAKLLIEKGANVHTDDCMGNPLELAVRFGHKEIAENLLKKGANCRGFMHDAVAAAKEEKNEEMIELLKKHNCQSYDKDA